MKEKKVQFFINPPPEDERCEVCQRHVDDLNPFGGPGDPLVGNFTGAQLVKHYRDWSGEGCSEASWECRDCFVLSTEECWNLRRTKRAEKPAEEPAEETASAPKDVSFLLAKLRADRLAQKEGK
jgi:hypothetical protein